MPFGAEGALGPMCAVRRRRTYAPCRDVGHASVNDVCACCDVAENVEANKLGLYMGTGAQKLEAKPSDIRKQTRFRQHELQKIC